MGAFGDSIERLIDTYSRCLSLLKDFSATGHDNSIGGSSEKLHKSIRADRSKIRKAYNTQLSLNDGLKKGDGEWTIERTTSVSNHPFTDAAESHLSRIIRRLKSTIKRLIRTMKGNPSPSLDYALLQSLSNSSRIDAVRTIDELSTRLMSSPVGGEGFQSTRSTVSRSSSRQSTPRKRQVSRRKSGSSSRSKKREASQERLNDQARSSLSRRGTSSTSTERKKRVSMATMASDSTKLGEVTSRRKLRRRRSGSVSLTSAENSPQPTYPLRPYQSQKPKRGMWGFLSKG